MTIVVETEIARSKEDVVQYLTDYANEALWQINVSEARVEPPGPSRVGTRVHKTRTTGAGVQKFVTEITAIDLAAGRWSDLVTNGPFQGTTGDWSVEARPGGSLVRLAATMRATGLWRLLLPIINASAGKDLRDEFANLKRVLEAR